MTDRRELEYARGEAERWLAEYARLARENNAPDDEHTRIQIRNLAERIIDDEFVE